MTDPSIGDVFELLSDRRYRYVLSELLAAGGETTLEPLAARVAARESGSTGGEEAPTAETTGRVASSLSEVDLPRLEARGLIEYDPERGTVALSEPEPPTDRPSAFAPEAASPESGERPRADDPIERLFRRVERLERRIEALESDPREEPIRGRRPADRLSDLKVCRLCGEVRYARGYEESCPGCRHGTLRPIE